MPPTLRRSVSSPTVRVAPYPTSSSASTLLPSTTLSTSQPSSAAVPGRSRRTASETSGRRVLADIEWWRVMQGQQSDGYDQDMEQETENTAAVAVGTDGDPLNIDAPRPFTPEPISPLYTVSEDAHTANTSWSSTPPSSTSSSTPSTPSRPRSQHDPISFPGLAFSVLQLLLENNN